MNISDETITGFICELNEFLDLHKFTLDAKMLIVVVTELEDVYADRQWNGSSADHVAKRVSLSFWTWLWRQPYMSDLFLKDALRNGWLLSTFQTYWEQTVLDYMRRHIWHQCYV